MPKLSAISPVRTETAVFPIGGEDVTLKVNVSVITPELMKRMTNPDADEIDELIAFLQLTIVEWDIYDENDVPYPITAEFLSQREFPFLQALSEGAMSAVTSGNGVSSPA